MHAGFTINGGLSEGSEVSFLNAFIDELLYRCRCYDILTEDAFTSGKERHADLWIITRNSEARYIRYTEGDSLG